MGVGVRTGVRVSVGLGEGTGVVVKMGVLVGLGVVIVTRVVEAGTVEVGVRVTTSSLQAMDKNRMRPKRSPFGANQRNGMITAVGLLTTDWDCFLSLVYRNMHNPPYTSSNSNQYKGLCMDPIAAESASYVKIAFTTLEWNQLAGGSCQPWMYLFGV